MKRSKSIYKMTAAALLIAVGIIIPSFFPRIPIEPMSFTLASHVAVFLSMFISPVVAIAVALGTTVGFLFSGMSYIVVLRAATHLIFAVLGSLYLKKHPKALLNAWTSVAFSFVIGVIHAVAEVAVVSVFYFSGNVEDKFMAAGFVNAVLLLVGVGTLVHSMIDFAIAIGVYYALRQNKDMRQLFVGA